MTGLEGGAAAGGIVAITMALIKIIDKLIDKKNGSPPVPVVLHDTNGNKITNKDLLTHQQDVVRLQRQTVDELKDLNTNLTAHNDKTVGIGESILACTAETRELVKEIRKSNGAT